ncbi:MAG: hypothetical protein AB1750_18400, partial [Chloroflexota bacterium]
MPIFLPISPFNISVFSFKCLVRDCQSGLRLHHPGGGTVNYRRAATLGCCRLRARQFLRRFDSFRAPGNGVAKPQAHVNNKLEFY